MVDDDFAGALDDLNGDYREVSLELYRRGPAGWLPIASIDDAGYPGAGEAGSEGWVSGVAYAFGRDKPNTTLTDFFFGETRAIQTNDAGWWLAARNEWEGGASST
jgi:hypothetical protein